MYAGILGFVMLFAVSTAVYAMSDLGLAAGEQAPDFTAETANGDTFVLSEAYADGPVILVFYRGGWCPYCNAQLQDFQRRLDDFQAAGAQVVAMSVDVPAKAAETAAEKNITFPLVTNPQADVLEAYNLAYQVPEELVTKYRDEYGIDLEGASGETHHKIAVPATFIIDQSGAIRFSHVDEDYRSRISAEDVLKQLP